MQFSRLGIKRLTKNKLWKVKIILKNSCSWNSKTCLINEYLYSTTLYNFHNFQNNPPKCGPWKWLLLNFRKYNERIVTYNLSKILVKYLWRSSLFKNLKRAAYTFTKNELLQSFFSRIFPSFLLGAHLNGCFWISILFVCLVQTKRRVLIKKTMSKSKISVIF